MQDIQYSTGYLFHKLSLSLYPLFIFTLPFPVPESLLRDVFRMNWGTTGAKIAVVFVGWLMRPQGLAGAEVVQVHSINSLASHFSSVSVRKLIFIINRDTILLQKHRGVHVRWFITIVANKWGWELTFAPQHQATALNSFEIRPFGALVIVQLLVATTTLIL